jgi:uncharacterized BrkB/YihY/UPF0761 family membrane protein
LKWYSLASEVVTVTGGAAAGGGGGAHICFYTWLGLAPLLLLLLLLLPFLDFPNPFSQNQSACLHLNSATEERKRFIQVPLSQ